MTLILHLSVSYQTVNLFILTERLTEVPPAFCSTLSWRPIFYHMWLFIERKSFWYIFFTHYRTCDYIVIALFFRMEFRFIIVKNKNPFKLKKIIKIRYSFYFDDLNQNSCICFVNKTLFVIWVIFAYKMQACFVALLDLNAYNFFHRTNLYSFRLNNSFYHTYHAQNPPGKYYFFIIPKICINPSPTNSNIRLIPPSEKTLLDPRIYKILRCYLRN